MKSYCFKIYKLLFLVSVLALTNQLLFAGVDNTGIAFNTSSEGQMRRDKFQDNFLQRQANERAAYSAGELREIENLYQSGNANPNSQAAKESLEKLISNEKYSKSNRFGCALIYLATMSLVSDAQAIDYLKLAIEKYGDCWYGDGVNVASYARYILAKKYRNMGDKEQAQVLFNEIQTNYPDSIDHLGNLLIDNIRKMN